MRFPPYWSEKLKTWIVEDEATPPGRFMLMQSEPLPREWPPEEDEVDA